MASRLGYLIIGSVVLFGIPIFRSGMRENLTLWEFIVNHTIYGPDVEYIPEELYQEVLSG